MADGNTRGPLADLRFDCVKESIPTFSGEPEALFQKARSMEKADGPKDFNAIASLYEKAGSLGHWKALQNLQVLYYQGLADHPKPDQRVIDINEQLIKFGAAIGYYNMATYLEQGYGVKQDRQAALAYYRKSADLGSPHGQTHVGKLFLLELKKDEIGLRMLECAAGQGSGDAAKELSIFSRIVLKDMPRSLSWAQRGVELGNEDLASTLSRAFEKGPNAIAKFGVSVDLERSRRYAAIEKEIARNPSARFPDINRIVPLPPAPLPAWDGAFEYRKMVRS